MVGDQARLLIRTAVGPANGRGESMQTIGLDSNLAHRALPLGHSAFPRFFLFRGARFPVIRALSTPKRRRPDWQSPCNQQIAPVLPLPGGQTGPRGAW